MLIDVINPITNCIFPPRCVVCNQDIARDAICLVCSAMVSKTPTTISTLKNNKPALFFYEGVIKQLVVNAKYYRSLHHAEVLMRLLEHALERSTILQEIAACAPDCVSAIPSHWLTRLIRGVDLPQLFALMLARMLAKPFVISLKRNSYFQRQTRAMNRRERIQGIVGAFSLMKTKANLGHILLVDDIVTTGATFDESKKLLKNIGEETTYLAIARTP